LLRSQPDGVQSCVLSHRGAAGEERIGEAVSTESGFTPT
jgi:hypothetical protein